MPLGETLTVDTPSGGETTSNLLMDDVGIYRYRDTTLAASMYNPQESDLIGDGASYPSGQFSMASAREAQTQNDLSLWVILLGAVLIIGEMALVWWRREANAGHLLRNASDYGPCHFSFWLGWPTPINPRTGFWC